jgi:amino-acid N-acetyltransferase
MTVDVERATHDDLSAIERLLIANQLPIDGVRQCLETALIVRDNGRVIACAAFERYPSGALLRSVAVDKAYRGHGLGQRLTGAALTLARERGAQAAYLLTTTAAGFFPRFGFETIDREEVPADVRTSVEFTSACPATARAMRADLGARRPGEPAPSDNSV